MKTTKLTLLPSGELVHSGVHTVLLVDTDYYDSNDMFAVPVIKPQQYISISPDYNLTVSDVVKHVEYYDYAQVVWLETTQTIPNTIETALGVIHANI